MTINKGNKNFARKAMCTATALAMVTAMTPTTAWAWPGHNRGPADEQPNQKEDSSSYSGWFSSWWLQDGFDFYAPANGDSAPSDAQASAGDGQSLEAIDDSQAEAVSSPQSGTANNLFAQGSVDSAQSVTSKGTCGTCEWEIDSAGVLTIAPKDGATVGKLADWTASGGYSPWIGSSITSVRFEKTVKAATCDGMFTDCESLGSIDLSGLDTSSVTSVSKMFSGCTSLKSVNLSKLNTSSVTDMGGMLAGCASLEYVDLSKLDTSHVTNMGGVFSACSALKSVNLSNLDTSSVGDVAGMFSGCTSLGSIDLSDLNTSGITDMGGLFSGCESLSSVNLSMLDVSNVANIGGMFSGCFALSKVSLPTGGFQSDIINGFGLEGAWLDQGADVVYPGESVAEIARYNDDRAITFMTIGASEGWTAFGTCEWMLNGDSALAIRPLGNHSAAIVDTTSTAQQGNAAWNNVKGVAKSVSFVGDVTVYSDPSTTGFLGGFTALESADLSGIGATSTFDRMFESDTALKSVTFPSDLTTIDYMMFYGCEGLTSIDIPSSIELIGESAFYGCTSLKEVTIPAGLNTANIGDGAFILLAEGSTITVQTQAQYDALVGKGQVYSLDRTTVKLAGASTKSGKSSSNATVRTGDILGVVGGVCVALAAVAIGVFAWMRRRAGKDQ